MQNNSSRKSNPAFGAGTPKAVESFSVDPVVVPTTPESDQGGASTSER
jgi:hypothetical protein